MTIEQPKRICKNKITRLSVCSSRCCWNEPHPVQNYPKPFCPKPHASSQDSPFPLPKRSFSFSWMAFNDTRCHRLLECEQRILQPPLDFAFHRCHWRCHERHTQTKCFIVSMVTERYSKNSPLHDSFHTAHKTFKDDHVPHQCAIASNKVVLKKQAAVLGLTHYRHRRCYKVWTILQSFECSLRAEIVERITSTPK